MQIKNRVIGVIAKLSGLSGIILYSSDRDNQIGLEIGRKYSFIYPERLADFTGTLSEFAISYNASESEIYLVAVDSKNCRIRKIQIKDLEKITYADDIDN
ncbi:MAG TPA: hypothetical protein DDY52_01345 [Candidatus Moranbacteria bacterium]|nr:MAG: hypothetical protein UR51_C0007G0018 [Candidatus Moranbacteria bacterium GW2011_GWF1_34_10]HBI16789.1 hypothetical protein [Candidatus Moranbacteria bacterium]